MAAEVIKLNYSEIKMAAGSSRKISATVLPASNETVSWSSSNEAVAVVDTTGYIIAKSAGSATITAQAGAGLSDSCSVTVSNAYVLVSVEEAKERLSIDFDNKDGEIQRRINSIIADLTYGSGIKAGEFASLDTEVQDLAKEYVLKTLYYDYYDLHNELNDSRLTRIMKQLQVIGGAI